MEHDRLQAENETLRRRLARLTEAILSISEDLDVDAVLEEIVDSARSLTDARYSAITTLDDSGDLQDLLIAGMTPEEKQALMSLPEGWALFDYLTGFREPLRIADLVAHTRSVGFPDSHLPVRTLLGTRIHDREKHIGNIFIAEKEGGEDFTPDDEETLEMFATQAAMAITNARRYGDERRTNADLEALINTSPVGVLVFDAQTRDVVKCNREARRILGGVHGHDTAPEQLLKQTTFRWIDGRVIPRPQVPLARALRGGETVRAEEIVIQRADGATVTTLVNATPIRSDDDEIMSVVVTIQDITPLEELERLRAEFLGMVSHELRAPLTSIKGSAATVLDASGPLDPGEVRQFFRIIEEQADQMRDLINNLLDLTRIESGSLPIAPEPTDLAAVIDQARNVFGSGGHRNTIEVNLMPNLPRIVVDRQRILQVLYNLFSNASKFSREWSTIRVSASLEDPHVAVSVADEGVGIAAEHLPRLFSKFSRHYGEAGETHVDGYGFGLAICKGIVEAHGGRIRAVSDGPGQGTRFTFTVPVVDDTTDLVTAEAAPVAAGTGQAPLPLGRILVIDDDPQILRYIRNALSDAGHSPVLTADASEVDHLLETESPDLVLLNLVMPGSRRVRADETHSRNPRRAGHRRVGTRRRPVHRQGLRNRSRRLRRQALLAHRAAGQDQGGSAATGGLPADGPLPGRRADDRLRGAQRHARGAPAEAHPDRVPAALRTLQQRRTGPELRPPAAAGLGSGLCGRRAACPHLREGSAPQAGRRCP